MKPEETSKEVLPLALGSEKALRRREGSAGTSVALEQLLSRALVDADFRRLLIEDRAKATERYNLNEADLAALEDMTPEELDSGTQIAAIVGMVCSVSPNKD